MNNIKLYLLYFDKSFDYNNLKYITSDDLNKIKNYKNEDVKYQEILSFYLKRKYIKDFYLDELKKPKSNKYYFNISHSKNLVALAINESNEIGLDLEYIDKYNPKLINYICNENELKEIKDNNDFYKIWVSKESLLKCVGIGIIKDLKTINTIPFDGIKEYDNESYYSHLIKLDEYYLSITLKSNMDFNVEIIKEELELN